MVNSFFDPISTNKIHNTPFFHSVTKDTRVWKSRTNGDYSIRSAYKLCTHKLIDTTHLRRLRSWHLIWKIQAPPKVKNMIWRVCRNCIPTRQPLQSKDITCPSNCVLCDNGIKDSLHIFLNCPNSLHIWCQTPIYSIICEEGNSRADAPTISSTSFKICLLSFALFLGVLFGVFGCKEITRYGTILPRNNGSFLIEPLSYFSLGKLLGILK